MSENSSSASSPEPPRRAAAVVVAGGAGRRMGGGIPKQYLEIRGEPILLLAVRPFLDHPRIGEVVVVLPPTDAQSPPAWLRQMDVTIVAGGAERIDSVRNGLLATPDDADPVLIHDGARPLASGEVIDRILDAASQGEGAVAGVPVTDTIKEVNAEGRIVATPDRTRLWQAQTPQGFPRRMILEAHEHARAAGISATDDAVLCERLGLPMRMVEGSPENIKITRRSDLAVAEALASLRHGV